MNSRSTDYPTLNPHSFIPDAQNSREYRYALGRFGTGVTIVSIDTPDGPIGMTVNSFASVSLDPPLILWSVSKSSGCCSLFESSQRFAVNVLHAEQTDLAKQFARTANDFSPEQWLLNEASVPVLNEALACFECANSAVHDGGDHTIIIGQVERATINEGEPLLFFKGQFGSFDQ